GLGAAAARRGAGRRLPGSGRGSAHGRRGGRERSRRAHPPGGILRAAARRRVRFAGGPMSSALQNKTIAILATDGVEQVELTEPRKAVEQAGATTRLLSIKDGEIQGMNHDKPADKLKVDGRVADAKVEEFDALILP